MLWLDVTELKTLATVSRPPHTPPVRVGVGRDIKINRAAIFISPTDITDAVLLRALGVNVEVLPSVSLGFTAIATILPFMVDKFITMAG
jgi:hypothetical protein